MSSLELSSHCHNDTWHLAWLRVRGICREYEFPGVVVSLPPFHLASGLAHSQGICLGYEFTGAVIHCHNDTWNLAWLIVRGICSGESAVGMSSPELSIHCHHDTWRLAWFRVRGICRGYEFTGSV
ncbi:hypothetical protein J6590_092918 [Homalodisca vitripennis]|nr:hypothetical protein J6590_092918 [Homalodisca vitripennis]